MKKFTLHIIFLLGFLLTSTGSHAQKNRSALEHQWQKLHQKIENSSLEVVKKSFDEFQNWAIQHHQDSILLEGILEIGVYYEKQGAFGERIKWYQYALDSLCGDDQIQCVKIRRELASIYAFIEQYGK